MLHMHLVYKVKKNTTFLKKQIYHLSSSHIPWSKAMIYMSHHSVYTNCSIITNGKNKTKKICLKMFKNLDKTINMLMKNEKKVL